LCCRFIAAQNDTAIDDAGIGALLARVASGFTRAQGQ